MKKNTVVLFAGQKSEIFFTSFVHYWGATECWGHFNSKQLFHGKFLQNPFLGCLWSPWRGKIIWSAVEYFYLMIWTKFCWRNRKSIRKLLRENRFLKIFISNPYSRSNFSPLLRLYRHPRNGIWKNFCLANCFELKSPQHSVEKK